MELNQREKLLAIIAAGLIVPLLLLRFVFFPFFDYKDSLGLKITRLQSEIQAIEQLGRDYKNTTQNAARGRVNQKVEAILTKLALRGEAVISSQDSNSVTLKVDGLQMAKVVELFYYIENTKPLKIKILSLTHSFKNEKRLELNLIVSGGGKG